MNFYGTQRFPVRTFILIVILYDMYLMINQERVNVKNWLLLALKCLFVSFPAKPSRSKQKTRSPDESIRNNLAQYGLEAYYCDIMVADASRHSMWRTSEIFDAIITDRKCTL